ncbi:hypothetical protein TNCV_391891 [Trichonephila clavipes]|nr:hypothetical protein TNCV_391891 [Trichonephila clavipes]
MTVPRVPTCGIGRDVSDQVGVREKRQRSQRKDILSRSMTSPKRGKFPKNTPYHDVFMGAMPSSRRGNASPFSVGIHKANSQAKRPTIDNSPPIKHIEHTKQISQAKRPTTDNSPPIKHIEHTKQISQAKRPTTDNSPPIKHIEHTKQISQAKRPTTDNSPPIKHVEHTKKISQAKCPTTDNSPPIKHVEHTKQLPSPVAQVHQRQIENATQG